MANRKNAATVGHEAMARYKSWHLAGLFLLGLVLLPFYPILKRRRK